MDFTTLPYEVQFNYLLDLPYKDVVHYCRTSPAANQICQTQSFWENKARRDFGITDYITGGNPVLGYVHLEEGYRLHPETLLPHLIRTGQMEKFRELLPRAQFYRVVENGDNIQYIVDQSYWNTINAIFDTQNRSALIQIITTLDTDDAGIRLFLLNPLLKRTIEHGSEEWIQIIINYSYPGDNIYDFYLDSIRNGDVKVVNYFLARVRVNPELSGWMEMYNAFLSGNDQIIDLFVRRYPALIIEEESINGLVESVISTGSPQSLLKLLKRITFTKHDLTRWIVYARYAVQDPEMVKVLESL